MARTEKLIDCNKLFILLKNANELPLNEVMNLDQDELREIVVMSLLLSEIDDDFEEMMAYAVEKHKVNTGVKAIDKLYAQAFMTCLFGLLQVTIDEDLPDFEVEDFKNRVDTATCITELLIMAKYQ